MQMNVTYTRFWGAHADAALSHADMARGVEKLLAPMTPTVYGPDILGFYNFVVTPEKLRGRTPVEYAHLGYSTQSAYRAARERPDHNSQNYSNWHFSFADLPEGHVLKHWEGRPFFKKTPNDLPFKDQSTSFDLVEYSGQPQAGGHYEFGDSRGSALMGASYLARIITKKSDVSKDAFLESIQAYLNKEALLEGAKAKVIRVVEDSFIEFIYADSDDELQRFLDVNPIEEHGELEFSQIALAISAQDLMVGRFSINPNSGGAFRLVWDVK